MLEITCHGSHNSLNILPLVGRGHQLIEGVEATSGDYLLFLHADTKLPKDFDKMAAKCIQTPGVVCGAFEFQLDVLQEEKL